MDECVGLKPLVDVLIQKGLKPLKHAPFQMDSCETLPAGSSIGDLASGRRPQSHVSADRRTR